MNLVRSAVFLVTLVMVVACSQSEVALAPQAVTKKFIDLSGYAHPNVAFIQKNLATMEANKPFDGIVFRVDPANGFDSASTPVLLDTRHWNSSSIDFNVLSSIPWKKF
jgi:hypothetical protein